MSMRLLNELKFRRIGSVTLRALVRSLCEFTNDNTLQCNPSLSMLLQDTEMSKPTLLNSISVLETLGVIERISGDAIKSTSYFVNLENLPFNKLGEARLKREKLAKTKGEIEQYFENEEIEEARSKTLPRENILSSEESLPRVGKNFDHGLVKNFTKGRSKTLPRVGKNFNHKTLIETLEETKKETLKETEEDFFNEKTQQEESNQALSSAPSLETPKKTSKKAAKAASELTCPEDVPADLWEAFLDHRKSLKKPFNAYALKLMRNQCAIAGWTLSQAMERVLADGWIGFRASFVKDEWIERLPGTGDTPIMVKREDYLRDQFVASDLSMFTPEAADLIQSVGVKNTRPFKDRLKPLKNVHSEKNVSNPSGVSKEDLSTDSDAFNDIPDDFKEGGER